MATWSQVVTVSGKHLTLNGQGTTTITWAITAPFGQLSITADTVGNTFITGFSFIGHGVPGTSPTPLLLIGTLSPLTKATRVYNNTFEDSTTGPQGVVIETDGIGPQLIDHNTFNIHHNAEETIHNMG